MISGATTITLQAEWLQELLVAGGWRDIAINEADGGGYDNKPTRWLYLAARK